MRAISLRFFLMIEGFSTGDTACCTFSSVSYTHLDVYKRQVRHDSERKNRGVAECAAGEYVQQTQQSVALQLAGVSRPLAQGVGVDARNHYETTQAVDQQQPDRVDHTFAQLLNLVDILERFNQFLVGRQKSDYH